MSQIPDPGQPFTVAQFAVTLDGPNPPGLPVSVKYNARDGAEGETPAPYAKFVDPYNKGALPDYQQTPASALTFMPADPRTKIISVRIFNNNPSVHEDQEYFSLLLTQPQNAALASGKDRAAGAILAHDDGAPQDPQGPYCPSQPSPQSDLCRGVHPFAYPGDTTATMSDAPMPDGSGTAGFWISGHDNVISGPTLSACIYATSSKVTTAGGVTTRTDLSESGCSWDHYILPHESSAGLLYHFDPINGTATAKGSMPTRLDREVWQLLKDGTWKRVSYEWNYASSSARVSLSWNGTASTWAPGATQPGAYVGGYFIPVMVVGSAWVSRSIGVNGSLHFGGLGTRGTRVDLKDSPGNLLEAVTY